jgi:hypothetical protein
MAVLKTQSTIYKEAVLKILWRVGGTRH